MASSAAEDFENDWTFVDKDGKVDIEPRKNSVSYSKSPSTGDEVLVSPSEVPIKDGSEGEAEFEVLSGFQCHPPPEVDDESNQADEGMLFEINNLHASSADNEDETEEEIVPIQQTSCQCAPDDGIMIISNHFCLNEDTDSAGDVTVDEPSASECDQENLQSSTISLDTADGWRALPMLSESGSFSFPSESVSSEDDNSIEPIPEEDVSQDFVDLSCEGDPLEEMVESRFSGFSFDSDLFNQSDSDKEVDKEEEDSDVTEVAEVGDKEKEGDQGAENVEEIEHLSTASNDGSSFCVDVPTLFVLLGVTTALGFSIGYGLSVYISSQALEVSGSIKRPGPKTASLPLTSDPMEPLDEVSRDFLDQLTVWKLEDRLDFPKEHEPDADLGDLFDTKVLHEKLQQKHFKLMSLHESVKQRLRMSKVMSWYWRLKYEEEKSKQGGGGEWNKALQEQLEHMEQLYLHEKHTADLWRRMNENTKLRRAVAGGIKFDKYWKDFLNRWKKVEDKSPRSNEIQKMTNSAELDEKPEVMNEGKKPEPNVQNTVGMCENAWREFRNRWTKDSQLKGRTGESSSKGEKCASEGSNKKRDLTVSSGQCSVTTVSQQTNLAPSLSPIFLDSATEKFVGEPETVMKNPEGSEASETVSGTKASEEKQSKNNREGISKEFKKGFQFDNVLFPRQFVSSWIHAKIPSFLKTDRREESKPSATAVNPKQTYLNVYWFPDSSSKLKRVHKLEDVFGEMSPVRRLEKSKTDKKSFQKADDRRVKSYQEYFAKTKCKKENEVQSYVPFKPGKISTKQDKDVDQRQLLTSWVQTLRNLSQHRGEEIRKQRIQRREWKKKEKEAKLRVEEAERFLSELKHERRRIKIEKRKLRRSWKVLKREKKKFSRERETHKKDKKGLEKFMAKLKKEKQKLKKLKGTLKKKMKKLLAKEKKRLKLKKRVEAEKKEEVERLRNEIAQEKDKLRKQQKALKSLKQAARKELKNWLRELRKIKRREKARKEAEEAKRREEEKKKMEDAEIERRKRIEYDAVVREQAKYDKEKRRKKGEFGEKKNKKKPKEFDRELFFRQQLENVKQWLSSIRNKVLERQQSYWGSLFAQTIFGANGEARNSEPKENERDELKDKEQKRDGNSEWEEELKRKSVKGEEKSGQSEWENEKRKIIKLMSGVETRDCEQTENKKWEMVVRKAELTKTSEDKALAGLVNLTFDVDLVETLLKGLEKRKREDKTTGDDVVADSGAFILVSKEDNYLGFDTRMKKSPKKPKLADHNRWLIQVPIQSEESRLLQQKTSEGPIPPNGIRMSPEEWYEKRSKVTNKRKEVVPGGPILSEDVSPVRSGEDEFRKRSKRVETDDKVCTPDDSEKRESIPPPDWVFERARDRAEQRFVPWYDGRAHDRYWQRSTDNHDTQFPCGRNWKHRADLRANSWYDRRAEDRNFQRSADAHTTQFRHGKKRKHRADQRSTPWYDRRAQDRAFQRNTDEHDTQFPCGQKRSYQRLNREPWYSRRAEGREAQRREGLDSWFLERGHYSDHFREWMPQGPSMDERR